MSDLARKVEELAGLLEAHQLTAIKVREGDFSVEVRRDPESVGEGQAAVPARTAKPEQTRSEGEILPSPMVGVFYSRPSPDEPPFLQEGQRVSVGQVVGIIEAMKVFNEVESPVSGVVRSRVAEDGQLVQQGDPLYVLDG